MSHVGNEATGRNRRGRLPVAVASVGALALLAACSGGGDAPSSEEVPSGGPIAITWYGSDARNDAIQQVVDNWSADSPDADVDVTTQPTTWGSYWDRVSVQASADDVACVAAMQSRYQARYEDRGNLLPLDGLIEDGTIDVSGIPESVLESNRNADGNLYVIPNGIWYDVTIQNVPRMEELGVTPPEPEGSWADYVDWAIEAQTQVSEDSWAIDGGIGGSIAQFQAYAMGEGESLFGDGEVGFSEETLTRWYEVWTRASEAGAVPPPEVNAEYSGVPARQSLLAEGRIMVSSTGDNTVSDIQVGLDQNEAGSLSLQGVPTGGVPQVVGANGWSISANCENVADSASFIDYFINTPENAVILGGRTGLPPVTSVLEGMQENPDVSQAIKDRIALYLELADDGATVDVWPDGTQTLEGQFATSYEEVAFGQTSPEEAAASFIEQADAALSGF